ncbi:MAG: RNA polymerase sigma factor [Deltaproteobacteria bacterium]|nr:MAG: RNA polymerase sigma factor [Deltaproteobacteria bacterium]
MTTLAQHQDPEIIRSKQILERAIARHCPQSLSDRREDLVQQALLKLIKRKGDALGELAAAYHWRVAYSVIIDELRRQSRRPEESITPFEGTLASPGIDPEREASSSQLREAISTCLEALHEPRRRAVLLHLQGHSVPEIAGLLSWTRKRAENNVYRGLADLRERLRRLGVHVER